MSAPSEMREGVELRDYLAAERTFLAWIRTGLALMGFGFVVARFGLFLEQLPIFRQAGAGAGTPSGGLSLWFGTTLIVVGVAVNISAAWQHTQLVRQLDRGAPPRCRPMSQNIAIALLLALVGLAMAIYLISVRNSSTNAHSEDRREIHMAQTAPASAKGMIEKPSNHSVDETVRRLKDILQTKGVALFALVDHSGEAEKVGMTMPPTKLLIFGNPKAGTPLMLAAPSIAIDLPLKILVWEDGQGKTRISYNSPEYLRDRHGLPQELLQNISVVSALAERAAE
jgi:uncharacterized protein (DUF302 family)/uncharacterized membrane protein YidH (DUF202 family)